MADPLDRRLDALFEDAREIGAPAGSEDAAVAEFFRAAHAPRPQRKRWPAFVLLGAATAAVAAVVVLRRPSPDLSSKANAVIEASHQQPNRHEIAYYVDEKGKRVRQFERWDEGPKTAAVSKNGEVHSDGERQIVLRQGRKFATEISMRRGERPMLATLGISDALRETSESPNMKFVDIVPNSPGPVGRMTAYRYDFPTYRLSYFVDPASGLVRAWEARSPGQASYEYGVYEYPTQVPDSRFLAQAPKGMQVKSLDKERARLERLLNRILDEETSHGVTMVLRLVGVDPMNQAWVIFTKRAEGGDPNEVFYSVIPLRDRSAKKATVNIYVDPAGDPSKGEVSFKDIALVPIQLVEDMPRLRIGP